MALRDGLMEAYGNDHALSWEGAWDIAKASLKGAAKGRPTTRNGPKKNLMARGWQARTLRI